MSLIQYENNGAQVIVLPEKLVMAECVSVKAAFKKIIENSTQPVLVDFTQLVFMDSSGLGALVNAYHIAKKEDLLFVLFNIRPTVLSLLELTQLDQVFLICQDEQEAYEVIEKHKEQLAASNY